jgi:hypothetical protein
MYHPMLIFERYTGCLLAERLRPGNASSHARIVPMLLRLVPRLQSAFPGVQIKLRGDAGFALPLLYAFCEFFDIEYAIGIPANCVFQRRAEPRQKQLKRRYRRTQLPQRSFSSFRHRARSWPRQRRICYKTEHTATGTNLRFVVTNCTGCASQVFAFYNDRGECENRIEELKNGFRADRLSCHRFLANAFRLLLHGFAYNLVNLFRLQLPQPWRSGVFPKIRGDLAGDITTESVEVKLLQPVLQHVSHVGAELRVLVVESGDIGPVGIRRDDVALGILLVKLGVLHQDTIPGGVVRNDVDDDLEPVLVRFADQALEVVLRAVGRINGIVILHRVRAADAAFLFRLSNGVDGHDPNDRDPEIFEIIEALLDAVEVARG